jgi:predicted porin
MHTHPRCITRTSIDRLRGATARAACLAALSLSAAGPASAIDFGPFSLTGFVKGEVTRVSTLCEDNKCQVDPLARKDFIWADPLVQGTAWGSGTTTLTLIQPYLGFKYDLPGGFKFSALLSQRWRDGEEDFDGYWYEKNVALSHEDYGAVRIGAMTTRAWSMADYPFGTDIGLSDPWASSGAGYGLLTRALRYTSPVFDVANGDLVVEGTYDIGESGWDRNKPRFLEVWIHYGKGDLSLDLIFQDTKNGTPSAFSHGPFTGLFYDPAFDSQLGESSQGIAMAMARYRVDSNLELLGGVRANRWSGAYAVLLQSASANPGGFDIWNNPFNVDWSTDLGGGVYKGYSARSVDLVLGGRYKVGKWAASAALLYLGSASTDNPTDRGGANSATIGTIGVYYDVLKGLQVYGLANLVNYGKEGLSPISMPSNSAFTNIDSRLTRRGNWFTAGVDYRF